MSVRIVQLLCGPKRHAIMGIAYEPGLSASLANGDDIVLTEANATEYLESIVGDWFMLGMINPWCELCKARQEDSWFYEDAPSKFETMEEAWPVLKAMIDEQKRFVRELARRKN